MNLPHEELTPAEFETFLDEQEAKPQANKTIELREQIETHVKDAMGDFPTPHLLEWHTDIFLSVITQAMLDALPEKYGLHIVKEMEELKEEIKNLHPSSNAYRDAERSRSMRMGRKVGFNEAIDQFESAIKLRGGEK